jgi:hypothetical protein
MGLVCNENQLSEGGSVNGCRNPVHINYTKSNEQRHDCNVALPSQRDHIPVDKRMWVYSLMQWMTKSRYFGRIVAPAVSCWLPTAAAGSSHVGFVVDKVAVGKVSPASLHSTNYSTVTIICQLGLYNRPVVAVVTSGPSLTPLKIIIIIIQFSSILYYLCAESTATRPITDPAQCRYK